MLHKFAHTLAVTATLGLLAAGCSSMYMPTSEPAQVSDGALTAHHGMTLYTFDKDVAGSGKSLCNGPCAKNWPPLMAGDGMQAGGAYSVITRDDGGRQFAYKGKPLYFWIKDSKPGDRTGDGFNGVWRVARP